MRAIAIACSLIARHVSSSMRASLKYNGVLGILMHGRNQ